MSASVFDRRAYNEKNKKALDLFLSLSGVAIDDQNIVMRRNTAHEIVDPAMPEYAGIIENVNALNAKLNIDKFVTTTSDVELDVDTFVMTTSADPDNTISSRSIKNVINLNVQDGGFF